jgi:hypothetical protein
MEDSLKGVLISLTVISLFITAVLSFVVIFPQEQGVSFSDPQSQSGYLTASNSATSQYSSTQSQLESINNASDSGLDQWDFTVGFMGSNAVKQSSKAGVKSYSTNIFSTLTTIATQVFGKNSPVLYVIAVLLSLTTGFLVYLLIKFIRTGN